MALDQFALLELLGELKDTDGIDRIRIATQKLYQELSDAEAAAAIGAAPFERTPERVAQRHGSRPKMVTTTAGQLDLRIPKLRQGSFFPSLLERRRRVDQALFAVWGCRPAPSAWGNGGLRSRGQHPQGRRPRARTRC